MPGDRAVAARRDRTLLERLAAGEIDETEDFLTRLDILHLLATREADGLGSFLGGRVRLFPHQLHVAERATARMPVRWLLADEVGLGKTIEAALIMNRLLHTRTIERCLVVAPEALTVQWLGELWRKYHQVFTLLDPPRLADVARDFGAGFNPFDVHRRAVRRARDAGRAAGADRAGGRPPASTCSSSTRRSGCGDGPGIPASRRIAPSRRSPRSAATCCCSARRRSKTTRTGSSGCCSCCGRTNSPSR